MKIYFSPKCLEFHSPGHPESPLRVKRVADLLKEKGYRFSEPHPCTTRDVLLVHSTALLNQLKGETFIEADTPPMPGIAAYAMLSAGAAIEAAYSALGGETAFSIMRPPGHHATRDRIMGFCYLNNIAIAAAHALAGLPESRIAILDFDCHHGNGTEAIFLRNPSVLYASLHQSPLYPGTGWESQANSMNFPLRPGIQEEEYMQAFEQACQYVERFQPALLGVSAGFDSFSKDPLSHHDLQVESFRRIGRRIADLKLPTFIVLEGGYADELPRCVLAFVEGMEGK